MERQYSGERTVLMSCSICPQPFEYPTQGRYCVDKLFRCWRCDETETPLDYERKQQQSRMAHDEQAPHGPIGPAPGWFNSTDP